jgi:hypothetical protein
MCHTQPTDMTMADQCCLVTKPDPINMTHPNTYIYGRMFSVLCNTPTNRLTLRDTWTCSSTVTAVNITWSRWSSYIKQQRQKVCWKSAAFMYAMLNLPQQQEKQTIMYTVIVHHRNHTANVTRSQRNLLPVSNICHSKLSKCHKSHTD